MTNFEAWAIAVTILFATIAAWGPMLFYIWITRDQDNNDDPL